MPEVPAPAGAAGITAVWRLPDEQWSDRWRSIFVDGRLKDRLLNYALLTLATGNGVSSVRFPLHRILLLSGPPGTGKTTLGRGLAAQAADLLAQEGHDGLIFVEVDAHAFASELLGGSQKSVTKLMSRTIPDLAAYGVPVVVLLDEIENIAVERSAVSMQANPIDVHRATNAALTGVDALAEKFDRLLFICTTNFIVGVDEAMLSRVDLHVSLEVPGRELASRILRDTMEAVRGEQAPPLDDDGLDKVLELTAGTDARRLRKLVLEGLIQRRALVKDPSALTWDDLAGALIDR